MPETSKRSTDWRTMDATLAIASEALHTARILMRHNAGSSANGCAARISTGTHQDAIVFSQNMGANERLRHDQERQSISMAARKLADVCDALKSVSTAIEANALAPNHKLIIDHAVMGGSADLKRDSAWSRQKQKLLQYVNHRPDMNDNLLLVRGSIGLLTKKFRQFVRVGAECFPGQDRLDGIIRAGAMTIARFVKRVSAVPFLRYSPASALKFLRFWKRFWSDIIAGPAMPSAALRDERQAHAAAIRPSATAALLILIVSAMSLLAPGSAVIEYKMPAHQNVRFLAADPITTGSFTGRAAPVWISKCSTRAWGKSCYPRRAVHR